MPPELLWYRLLGHPKDSRALKHYPKYYTDTTVDTLNCPNRKWFTRFKRAKVIKSTTINWFFQNRSPHYNKAHILNLLHHQRKHLRKVKGVPCALTSRFPNVKSFALKTAALHHWNTLFSLRKIEKVSISFNKDFQGLSDAEIQKLSRLTRRFMISIQVLNILKCLEISIQAGIDQFLSSFCEKLNSFACFLNSLTNLRIKIKSLKPQEESLKQSLFLLSNVLQNITELDLQNTMHIPSKFPMISHHGHKPFTKLVWLRISLPSTSLPNEGQNTPSNLHLLKSLAQLDSLQDLKILFLWVSQNYFLDFLASFCLPKNLKNIDLSLKECLWNDLLEPSEDLNPFESLEILQEFYGKWAGLAKLEKLHLCVENSASSDLKFPGSYFFLPLLKRVMNLKALTLEGSNKGIPGKKQKSLSWLFLWESIQQFGSRLENLNIHESAISLTDFDGNLPEIKQMELGKFVFSAEGLGALVNLFKEEGDLQEKMLILDQFVITEEGQLELFMNILRKIPKNLNLRLGVEASRIKREDLIEGLCQHIPAKWRNKSIDVSFINIPIDVEEEDLRRIDKLLKESRTLRYLELMKPEGQTVLYYDSRNKTKTSVINIEEEDEEWWGHSQGSDGEGEEEEVDMSDTSFFNELAGQNEFPEFEDLDGLQYDYLKDIEE